MNDALRPRERRAWMAAVTVLAISAAWLGALVAVLALPRLAERMPAWAALGRALLRTAWLLGEQAALPALLTLIGAGLFAGLALVARRASRFDREVRHA